MQHCTSIVNLECAAFRNVTGRLQICDLRTYTMATRRSTPVEARLTAGRCRLSGWDVNTSQQHGRVAVSSSSMALQYEQWSP